MSSTQAQKVLEIIKKTLEIIPCPALPVGKCIGQTTKRKRCTRSVCYERREFAANVIVEMLPYLVYDQQALLTALIRVAKLASCKTHQYHAALNLIAHDWLQDIVHELDGRYPAPNPRTQRTQQTRTIAGGGASNDRHRRNLQPADRSYDDNETASIPEPQPVLDNVCYSCHLPATDPVSTPSGDKFCGACITKWFKDNKTSRLLQLAHKAEVENLCYACREPLQKPVSTPSGHKFCAECISKWLVNDRTCQLLKLAKEIDVEEECGMCYEEYDNESTKPVRTPCGHFVCRECMTLWLGNRREGRCGTCRRLVKEADLVDAEV